MSNKNKLKYFFNDSLKETLKDDEKLILVSLVAAKLEIAESASASSLVKDAILIIEEAHRQLSITQ